MLADHTDAGRTYRMMKIINWSFERASWQWDILCILIMAFIFLTPKSWFNYQRTVATNESVSAVQTEYVARVGDSR